MGREGAVFTPVLGGGGCPISDRPPAYSTREGGFAGEVTQIQEVLISRRRFTDMQMVIHARGDAHSHSGAEANKY